MKIKFPQIKMIPTRDGFARGSRLSEHDLKTVSKEDFGTQPIDDKWLLKQSEFMMKLSDNDLYTVISYTTRSHQWITPFMRSGKIPGKKELKNIVEEGLLTPLYPQITTLADRGVKVFGKKTLDKTMFRDVEHRNYVRTLYEDKQTPLETRYLAFQMLLRGNDFSERTLKMALTVYVKDMKRIMNSAPPTTSDFVLFRGSLTNVVQKKHEIITKEFLSTTFSLHYALAYSTNEKNSSKGRIMRILLPKGSKSLALCLVNPFDALGEFEILIQPGKFEVIDTNVVRNVGNRKIPTNTLKLKR